MEDLKEGTVLDERYELIERIGSGAMADVWRARQLTAHGRSVAVKALRPELMGSAAVVKRFSNEAKAIGDLRHPSIVRLIDQGFIGGKQLYFVTELIRGESLAALLLDGPISQKRVVNLLIQAAEALLEVHPLGIIHRDLKPENMMVEQMGDRELLKILDFGVAAFLDQPKLTATGVIVGTPGYMAPEQIHGEPLDGRCDLYALGAIAYHALAGQPPFTAMNPVERMLEQVNKRPRPIQELAPVDPMFARLVMQLLSNDRNQRPSGAHELLNALRSIQSANPPSDDLSVRDTIVDTQERAPGGAAALTELEKTGMMVRATSVPPRSTSVPRPPLPAPLGPPPAPSVPRPPSSPHRRQPPAPVSRSATLPLLPLSRVTNQRRWASIGVALALLVLTATAVAIGVRRSRSEGAAPPPAPALPSTAVPPPNPTPPPVVAPPPVVPPPPVVGMDPRRIDRAVVSVLTESARGSGFIAAPGGQILTNRHVVQGLSIGTVVRIRGLTSGGPVETTATLSKVDEEHDLALLFCPACASVAPLPLGAASEARVGTTVYAFGSPAGLENTLTRGIISHQGRKIEGVVYLQSDVAINAGNSGGPLVSERGEVLGVVTAQLLGAEGIAFALPIEYALDGPKALLFGLTPSAQSAMRPTMRTLVDTATPLNLPRAPGPRAPQGGAPAPPSNPSSVGSVIQISAAETHGGLYGVAWQMSLRSSRPYVDSDRFHLVLQRNNEAATALELGHVVPLQILERGNEGTTTYRFEWVGRVLTGSAVNPGTVAMIRLNDDMISAPVQFVTPAQPTLHLRLR